MQAEKSMPELVALSRLPVEVAKFNLVLDHYGPVGIHDPGRAIAAGMVGNKGVLYLAARRLRRPPRHLTVANADHRGIGIVDLDELRDEIRVVRRLLVDTPELLAGRDLGLHQRRSGHKRQEGAIVISLCRRQPGNVPKQASYTEHSPRYDELHHKGTLALSQTN